MAQQLVHPCQPSPLDRLPTHPWDPRAMVVDERAAHPAGVVVVRQKARLNEMRAAGCSQRRSRRRTAFEAADQVRRAPCIVDTGRVARRSQNATS